MAASGKSATPDVRQAAASSAQEGSWLYQQLRPDSAAANLCLGFRVDGPLQLAALRAAWLAVLQRHEVLRTNLVEVDGRPLQQILPVTGAGLRLLDLTGAAAGEAELWCAKWARRPFQLAHDPLAWLYILRLEPQRHLVLLIAHRAVADERSMSILVRDLSSGYASAVIDGTARVAAAELPVRYCDYVGRQRPPAHQRGVDWWTATLSHRVRAAPPAGPGRPRAVSERAGRLGFRWGAELGRELGRFCLATGHPPAAVLSAGCQAVLPRHGRRRQLEVGIRVAGRCHPDLANLVGPLDDLVVIGTEPTGRRSFAELVAATDRGRRQAIQERSSSLGRWERALGADREPGSLALCDVVIAVADGPPAGLSISDAAVHRFEIHSGALSSDLALRVDRLDTVSGTLGYRTDLLDPAGAAGLLDRLRSLLSAGLREPAARLDELSAREVPAPGSFAG
ncbi:MAG: condensation domain-containing protein [Jatrophihabitans sp.]